MQSATQRSRGNEMRATDPDSRSALSSMITSVFPAKRSAMSTPRIRTLSRSEVSIVTGAAWPASNMEVD